MLKIDLPSEISPSAEDLLRKMLERNVDLRLNAKQILCHPWLGNDNFIQKIDWH